MMSPSLDMVTLKTSDDEIFEVEASIVMERKVVEHMIEDDCVNNVISLKNVSSKVLRRVIEYCQKHVESGAAATSSNDQPTLRKWDSKFIKVDLPNLIELLHAANYLDIKDLLSLAGQAVANMIKGRSVEDIRRIFNIKNDFSPDEEAQVKRQNQWAFEEADNCLP